ncbi:MAG: aminotransferase class V-fold PLP-dependent enzyme [Pyramidobacter sp.]|jgi:cysteine desulfurase/selenocysteine lyase
MTVEEKKKEEERIRSEFPFFETHPGEVYLDNSATTQKPRCVLEAVSRFYEKSNANPLRGLYQLSLSATEAYENARETVRGFIGAREAAEIVFTRNATESLNLLAYSWGMNFLTAGDEIVVSAMEHHSNLLPWQQVARRTGATLKFLECDQKGVITAEALCAALTPRTKLLAITQVSNVLGVKNDIKTFARLCRENGTLIAVDGAQSVPHVPVDVQDLGVDFLAFSGHKMLAPMGIGVLYGRSELLEKMPPFLYGGEMIQSVTREGAVFAPIPHKFEAGTVNAAGAVGLAEAIGFIRRTGFSTIQRRENELCSLALEEMKKIPHLHVLGSDHAEEHHGILSFVIDGVHPHDVAAIFDEDRIDVRAGHHCAQPLLKHLGYTSTTRASLSFYNSEEDVRRFVQCLLSIRRRMGYHE